MEKKQISITILGQECKIMANDPQEEKRIRNTVTLLEQELESILSHSGVSQVTALIYAALNMGDRLYREQEAMENLRVQITESADLVAKLEKELQKQDKPKRKESAKTKAQKEAKALESKEAEADVSNNTPNNAQENTQTSGEIKEELVEEGKDFTELADALSQTKLADME